jgi:uncharacterized protein YkwD
MKKLHFLFLLCGFSFALPAQVLKSNKLSAELNKTYTDSVKKIERLASVLFHEKINQYREANGQKRMGWDDTLWLCASNHNKWMVSNDDLDHHEKSGTVNFTGDGPGERYNYASDNKGGCSWCGENILYNYADGGSTIKEIADRMATYSFNQWRNSPGHNRNMLSSSNRVHAVAFMLDKGRVWATNIFSSQPRYSSVQDKPAMVPGMKVNFIPLAAEDLVNPGTDKKAEPVVTASVQQPEKKKETTPKFVSASAKYVKLDLSQSSNDILSALYSSAGTKQSKSLSKAAAHHADYMAANKKLVHDEAKQKRKYYAGSPQRRIIKASRGVKLVHKKTSGYTESIAMIQADAAKFNAADLSKEIIAALDKERASTSGTTKSVGFGLSIKRNKNELTIYVVREELVKGN